VIPERKIPRSLPSPACGHSVHVARTRHHNDKKVPDHWRAT